MKVPHPPDFAGEFHKGVDTLYPIPSTLHVFSGQIEEEEMGESKCTCKIWCVGGGTYMVN